MSGITITGLSVFTVRIPVKTIRRQGSGDVSDRAGVVIVKINTDAHPALAQRFGVRGIPAVKLFVDGAVAAEFTGALPEAQLREWLSANVP